MNTIGIVLLSIAGGVLAVAVTLCCGALTEVFRQLADIRAVLDLDDKPVSLDLGREPLRASELGLPESIATMPEAIVVMLSSKCATCLTIAHAFHGGAPDSVWFLLDAEDHESSPLRINLADSAGRIVSDREGRIAGRLGLEVTPSVLTIRYGDVVRAQAVSSARQVLSLVPVVAPIGSALDRPPTIQREVARNGV
jgi:hypothetical protein